MIAALFFKEWREKALLFFFELGVLLVLLAAQVVYLRDQDIRELLAYAVLLVFFPFAALLLGASGFDVERRQGAWAYLFSRPVGRPAIWLAKLGALASLLGALWLAFLAVWLASPGIRPFTGGPRILVGFHLDTGFPFWSLWLSAFLLTVAFSLSFLHERQLNGLFLAVILSLALIVAAWSVLISRPAGMLAWLSPSKTLIAFLVSQILFALAFAAASVLTLSRSDFSQPRRQIRSFALWLMPFFVLAVAGTAAWVWETLVTGEREVTYVGTSGEESFYVTPRGIFKYSPGADRVRWLVKAMPVDYFSVLSPVSGGTVAYLRPSARKGSDPAEEFWTVRTDGSARRRIIVGGLGKTGWPQDDQIRDLLVSPDGAKVAILGAILPDPRQVGFSRPRLWTVRADGSGLEDLTADPSLFGEPSERYSLWLVAWIDEGRAILLVRRTHGSPSASLWRYDLDARTARPVLDKAFAYQKASQISPRGDALLIRRRTSPEAPSRLALLDLATLATKDIPEHPTVEAGYLWTETSWAPAGDRLAMIYRRGQAGGGTEFILAVYSLTEGRTVAEKTIPNMGLPAWAADGARLLILDRANRVLKVLGPDLREAGEVPVPAAVKKPTDLHITGRYAMILDYGTQTVWRLNLEKKAWKKVY